MSATYPPESQQSPPQPPPEVRPPHKRRRVRKTLLIIGGAFTALIVLIVIIAVATSHGTTIKPAAAAPSTSATATPSTPTARSYLNAPSLLTAMAAHGAVCSGSSFKSGGVVSGEVNPFVECSGASTGDTAIVVFTTTPARLPTPTA